MTRLPPRSTRTDTRFPCPTLFRPIQTALLLAVALGVAGMAAAGQPASILWLAGLLGAAIGAACMAIALRSVFGPLEERSEEHTSELQSLMRISYAVFCLKKKKTNTRITKRTETTIYTEH